MSWRLFHSPFKRSSPTASNSTANPQDRPAVDSEIGLQMGLSSCCACNKDVQKTGNPENRTGFLCVKCQAVLHFSCAGLETYKTGVLPKAVIAFFDCSSVKIPLEKVLFCPHCSPSHDGEGRNPGDEDEQESLVDVGAWQAVEKLELVTAAISAKLDSNSAKLDFIADFLTPPDIQVEDVNEEEEKLQSSGQSCAGMAKMGTYGLSGMVAHACVQAQKEISEAELMSRTVIFDNVPEKSSDWKDAEELFHALYLTHLRPEEIFRLGVKRKGKPRKLKVILRSVADKETVLGPQIRQYLRDSHFPFQGVYVNPSRPFEEPKMDYLIRQRKKELNQQLNEEDQYFIFRAEHRLVKKENGQADWNWKDDGFNQWVKDFEEKEERGQNSAKRQSLPKQHGYYPSSQTSGPKQSYHSSSSAGNSNSSEWHTVQNRRGRQAGNGRGGMRH